MLIQSVDYNDYVVVPVISSQVHMYGLEAQGGCTVLLHMTQRMQYHATIHAKGVMFYCVLPRESRPLDSHVKVPTYVTTNEKTKERKRGWGHGPFHCRNHFVRQGLGMS